MKENVLKVLVNDAGKYGDAAEFDTVISKDDALKEFDDPEGFIKRNRIREDVCTLYPEFIKDASDRAVLEKKMHREHTGWIDLSKVGESVKATLIADSLPEERQTEWDMLSFEEMGSVCSGCELSWDKGRGCLGSFGPDNSALPEIASRYGCAITASVPDGASNNRIYTKDDAAQLLKEIPILRDSLEKEGKLAVRRYAGAVDRLEAVAKISVREGCGIRFF